MSQIRAIKKRMLLVRKTQKITKAMQMIAGIKLRRTEALLSQVLPCFETVQSIVRDLSSAPLESENFFVRKTSMTKSKDLLVVITSDKGLCGNYNSSIISKVKLMLKKEDFYDTILVGQRGFRALSALKKPLYFESNTGAFCLDSVFENIRDRIIRYYPNYDRVWLVFMKCSGKFSASVQLQRLFPIAEDSLPSEAKPLWSYEKNEVSVVNNLVNRYAFSMLKWAWIESVLSEESLRMMAMDSATNNGTEMLRSLSLVYNRLRQAGITREIIEITSGAEALASSTV